MPLLLRPEFADLPDHTLILLLPDVAGHLTIHLTRTQRHRQCFRHIVLNCYRYGDVLVRRAHPHVSRADVLKLTWT